MESSPNKIEELRRKAIESIKSKKKEDEKDASPILISESDVKEIETIEIYPDIEEIEIKNTKNGIEQEEFIQKEEKYLEEDKIEVIPEEDNKILVNEKIIFENPNEKETNKEEKSVNTPLGVNPPNEAQDDEFEALLKEKERKKQEIAELEKLEKTKTKYPKVSHL